MPGSNKAVCTGVLQGVTAHLPLIIIPPGSPSLPSDSISEQLQNTRKPAPPATPITSFQNQLSVQLVSVGWFYTHVCLSLSALKSLIRRFEIAIHCQQAPLTPLTESSACTWSALFSPSWDRHGGLKAFMGKPKAISPLDLPRKGVALGTLHFMLALL